MKKKTVDFTVLMSGPHQIPVGKKVHVRRDGEIFFVSAQGKEFGLLKESTEGTMQEVRMLREEFDGIVIESAIEDWQLKIRIPLERQKRAHSFQTL